MADDLFSGADFEMRSDTTLKGEIVSIRTYKLDSGWAVVDLHPKACAVGCFANEPRVGDSIVCTGNWTKSPRYGPQFKFTTVAVLLPTSLHGRARYLDENIPEIGPVRARALAEYLGEEVFEKLDENPDIAKNVPGIGPVVAGSIAEAWPKVRKDRELLSFLMGLNVSVRYAEAIRGSLGDGALTILRNDPYQLSDLVPGFGFKNADKAALSFGIKKDAFCRLRAGAIHLLKEAAGGPGHVYLPIDALIKELRGLLELKSERIIEVLLPIPEDDSQLIGEAGDALVYLRYLYADEVLVAESFIERNSTMSETSSVASSIPERFSEEQKEAVRLAVQHGTLILTGGPGTGKTTTVEAIIQEFSVQGLKVSLCAPTGRAAKRLSEVTGRPASTIHRLLEYNPAKGWQRNSSS